MPPSPPRVAVVGSLNIDLIAQVRQLPRPGETVLATGLVRRFGGKGANQALAAARQGAAVSMIGCFGSDNAAHAYRDYFEKEGIDCGGIVTKPQELTGTALIAVEASSENSIIVAPGANGALTAAMVRRESTRIAAAAILLLQFEVPQPAVLAALAIARRAKVPVLLNPSPWRTDFPWGTPALNSVVVNEQEAPALLGRISLDLKPRTVTRIRTRLAALKIGTLIITRGPEPTLCFSAELALSVPTFKVRPVDTVGAGDAFTGTLATALAQKLPLSLALRRANAAGALASLRRGAQEALPTAAQVTRACRELA